MKHLSDEKLSVVNVLHAYSSLPYQIVRDGGGLTQVCLTRLLEMVVVLLKFALPDC
jgi:hypothetical protein